MAFMGGPNLKGAKKFAAVLLLGLFLAVCLWRLGNLTTGLSPAEAAARQASHSWQAISQNPLNGPHKLAQLTFFSVEKKGAFWMRLVSVLSGIVFIGCFYLLSRLWFGKTVGILATLLFATSPWLILTLRGATPNVLLLIPIALLTAYSWLVKSAEPSWWKWLALTLAVAASLYVPGMIWLVLAGIVWTRKYLVQILGGQRMMAGFGLAVLLVLTGPLLISLATHPQLFKDWLAIPSSWPSALEILKSLAWAGLSIIWRTPSHLDFTIGRLPILNLAQTILVLFGGVALFKLARRQMYSLAGIVLLAIVLAGLNRDMRLLVIALPALGLIAGAGLRYLYMEWHQVFPFNPLPRYLAVFLLCLMIGLNAAYGIRYGLQAWPHTLETRSTYVLK